MPTETPEQADALNAAFAEGVEWMQGEDFCEQDFQEWYFRYQTILDPISVAYAFDLELPYEYQWLMISVLGMTESLDETVLTILQVAYEDGNPEISHIAQWALIERDCVRFGLNEFFRDLATYASWVCATTPQQLELF